MDSMKRRRDAIEVNRPRQLVATSHRTGIAMSHPVELFGYPVVGRLGEGAGSTIYRIRDPRSGTEYAIKHVVKRSDKDQRFIDQVVGEYRIGTSIEHESIRRIGRLFRKRRRFRIAEVGLVMECVEAPSLDTVQDLSLLDKVRIFIRLAEGLKAMHDAGYVHADMKPTNVLVDGTDVRIIDLGQACEIGTTKDRIQGTPGYIAPEQAHRRRITERTDVYNLGATMYWSISGRLIPTALPPKGGETEVSSGPLGPDRIAMPVPLVELVPGTPPELAELVQDCVRVSRGDRPATMIPVIDRLLRVDRALSS
jgi:serine/threonine-protein kinase